jgi:hypothetical protein
MIPVAVAEVFLGEGLILEGGVFVLGGDVAASSSVCHLEKSVMSLSAGAYHFFWTPPHLAPSPFASSF